jgi:hypothetical protein
MNHKIFLIIFVSIYSGIIHGQSFEPVIIPINSAVTSYTVPTGYSLKIESIAYDPNAINNVSSTQSVGVNIDGAYTLLFWRYYGSHEREIKTPFWLPEGTVLSKSGGNVTFYCLLFSNTTL